NNQKGRMIMLTRLPSKYLPLDKNFSAKQGHLRSRTLS
ncbi:hypothetical protein TNIN_26511, partial [Trichonephila inaurata madagascariensis]